MPRSARDNRADELSSAGPRHGPALPPTRVRLACGQDGNSKGSRREQAARFTAAAIRADRWDFRSLGTTLASPYLAAGRISAYVVFWVSAVHAGAGSLLVTEAGGTLSDLDGRPWTIRSDALVGSANPDLHEELLGLARGALGLPL